MAPSRPRNFQEIRCWTAWSERTAAGYGNCDVTWSGRRPGWPTRTNSSRHVGEPGVAAGRRVEVAPCPVQDDVLGAAGLGCLAACDGRELAVARAERGVQAAQGLTEAGQGFGGRGWVPFHEFFERRRTEVLDQRQVGLEIAAGVVEHQQLRCPHPRVRAGGVVDGEQVAPEASVNGSSWTEGDDGQ